jgi:4-aminobutyrate aminotransferase
MTTDPNALFLGHESPGTKTFAVTEAPPVFVGGRGAELVATDGRRYLDFAIGSGTTSLGHDHPAIRKAVEAQVASGILHIGPHFHTVSQARLFERLLSVLPAGLDRLQPATNGTEATEAALKIAMHATGRERFLVFDGGYHGRTLGALAVSAERGANARLGPFWPPVDVLPYPATSAMDAGDPARVAAVMDDLGRRLDALEGPYAAVIVEPVQATAGMRIPVPGALALVAAVARRNGWPIVADEVFTAFGRTGHLFASTAAGLDPDLVILAKSFGGGVPAGLVAGRSSFVDRLPKGAQSSTFQLHPLAAAASTAMIETIVTERLDLRAVEIAGWFEARRADIAALPSVADMRGVGALWGVEIACAMDPRARTRRIRRAALEAGLLTWECGLHGEVVGLVPPLTVDRGAVDGALDILARAITRSAE